MPILRTLYSKFTHVCSQTPYWLIALACRVAVWAPFWRSGQSKLDGAALFGIKYELWNVKASKIYLFSDEFGFPDAVAPAAAHMAAIGENVLSTLVLLGLLTRFGAAGLLVMVAVIQFYVFPSELLNPNGNWSEHLLWTAPLLVLIQRGGGAISLDALFGRNQSRPSRP